MLLRPWAFDCVASPTQLDRPASSALHGISRGTCNHIDIELTPHRVARASKVRLIRPDELSHVVHQDANGLAPAAPSVTVCQIIALESASSGCRGTQRTNAHWTRPDFIDSDTGYGISMSKVNPRHPVQRRPGRLQGRNPTSTRVSRLIASPIRDYLRCELECGLPKDSADVALLPAGDQAHERSRPLSERG